jgi:hypothetical protein
MKKKSKTADLAETLKLLEQKVQLVNDDLLTTRQQLMAAMALLDSKGLVSIKSIEDKLTIDKKESLEAAVNMAEKNGLLQKVDIITKLNDVIVYRALPQIIYGYKLLAELPEDKRAMFIGKKAGDKVDNDKVEILNVYRRNEEQDEQAQTQG